MKFATGPLAIFNILINLGFPLWRSTHDKEAWPQSENCYQRSIFFKYNGQPFCATKIRLFL